MKALVLDRIDHISLQEMEKPHITQPGDAIVKIALTTIYGSDLHLIHGHMKSNPPYVLGHEMVGVVESVGEGVTKIKPGDRVACPPGTHCGFCENCKKGWYAHCLNGGPMGSGLATGGTHAEYILIPYADENLVPIPETVTNEQALLATDIFATGYTAVKDCELKPGGTIVIIGPGPVALAAVIAAKLFNPGKIIIAGRTQERLDKALELGAHDAINTRKEDMVARVMELTGGRGADGVVETASAQKTLEDGLRCLGVHGILSMVGIPGDALSVPFPEVFMKNLTIRFGLADLSMNEHILQLIEEGKIDLTPLITHYFPLEEIETAIDMFENKKDGSIKIAIRP
ncbi:MAG: alcohol dehydrogenase catalytic domain-containing protein [Lachnospiraceae bacterium]|nr:alcohol dehydrogenase catalytic domain-containing protein [Lachnospiraceae bacterium]